MPRGQRAQRSSAAYAKTVEVTGFGVEVEFCASSVEDNAATYLAYLGHDDSIRVDDECDYSAEAKFGPFHLAELGGREAALVKFKETYALLMDTYVSEPYVNDSCGLHVHVGLRYSDGTPITVEWWNNREMMRLIRSWRYFEAAFFSTIPAMRRRSNWCEPLSATSLDYARNPYSRYQSMNLTALGEHGTIEFRFPPGTVDYPTIERWVKLLLAFCDMALKRPLRKQAVRNRTAEERTQRLFKLLKDTDLQAFMESSINRYGYATNLATKPMELPARKPKDATTDSAPV